MVIPMGAGPAPIRGPVPAECQQILKSVRFSVILMLACAFGRLMSAAYMGIFGHELFNLLNELIVVSMGVFVLKEDEKFKEIYNFLATSLCVSCHEQGMGGLGCVMPFTLCSGLNFIFDVLFKFGVALSPRAMPYGLFLFGSILAEGAGAFFGYKMYTTVVNSGLGMSGDTEMGGGGPGGAMPGSLFSGGGAYRPTTQQQGTEQQTSTAPEQEALAPQPGGFQAFAGTGHRLGS